MDELKDISNSDRLVEHLNGGYRYCPPLNLWIYWNGRRWVIDYKNSIQEQEKDRVRRLYKEAEQTTDESKKKELLKKALKSDTLYSINATIKLARSSPNIPVLPEEFDKNSWLLNIENGRMDLQESKLNQELPNGFIHPHKREDMMTKMINAEFDPEAQCPKWLAFLELIMLGNDAMVDFLQRMCGYFLTGKTGEHKLFFLYGGGRNGKSTFLWVLLSILGDYAKKVSREILLDKPVGSHTTDFTDLKGCRLAITTELPEGKKMAEAQVKEITGGDRLTARRMRENNVEFDQTAKIIFCANHKPIVSDTTISYWERMCLIPFLYVFKVEERVKDYHEVLLEEKSGILNWMLVGCQKWQSEGLKEPPEKRMR